MSRTTDGVYTVQFQSNVGLNGAGVVTLSDLNVTGGDSAFVFEGKFEEKGRSYSGEVLVKKHAHTGQSIFGPGNTEFKLWLDGNLDENGGMFSGEVCEAPQLRLTVRLQKHRLQAA